MLQIKLSPLAMGSPTSPGTSQLGLGNWLWSLKDGCSPDSEDRTKILLLVVLREMWDSAFFWSLTHILASGCIDFS